MDAFLSSFFKMDWPEWVVLFSVLSLLTYTALIIKNEKKFYLQWAKELIFDSFVFLLPPWWTPRWITREMDVQKVEFIRTDTHYDWVATLESFNLESSPTSTQDSATSFLMQKLKEREIELDQEYLISTSLEEMTFNDPRVKEFFDDGLRLEGTGTQKKEERIYLDIFCFRKKKKDEDEDEDEESEKSSPWQYLLFSNWSSVLYGSVEGPYFEEMIKRLSLKLSLHTAEKRMNQHGIG